MSLPLLRSGKLARRQTARISMLSPGNCSSLSPPCTRYNARYLSSLFSHSSRHGTLQLSLPILHAKHAVLTASATSSVQRRSLWWKSSPPANKPEAVAEGTSSAAVTSSSIQADQSQSVAVSEAAASGSPAPPASEAAVATSETIENTLTSTVESIPVESTASLVASIPPLQYGDLAALGLISNTPAGLIRWSFEVIQVTSALPWFHTIILGSLLWRVLLTPFVVQNLQNTARLQPLQPKLLELQQELKRASGSGDRLAMQRVALKQRKIYSDAGVSMWKTLTTPFVQLPVTLGLFFGIRKMCNLPVEQLKDSGVSWLPDLTVPDPYGVLPWALMVMVNVQISAGAKEMNLKERPEMGHLMNFLRVMTLAGVYVMGDFPSGLMVSLLVTSSATTAQTLLLQSPTLRRYFNIPIVPTQHRGKLPSFKESIDFVIHSFKQKMEEGRRAHYEQMKKRR